MHKVIGVPRTFGRDCTYIQIYIHLPSKSMETIWNSIQHHCDAYMEHRVFCDADFIGDVL